MAVNIPLTFKNPVITASYSSRADIYDGVTLATFSSKLLNFQPKRFEQEMYMQYNKTLKTGPQLIKEFPACHETPWFITALKKILRLSLS
jgi:hypothetical protein